MNRKTVPGNRNRYLVARDSDPSSGKHKLPELLLAHELGRLIGAQMVKDHRQLDAGTTVQTQTQEACQ